MMGIGMSTRIKKGRLAECTSNLRRALILTLCLAAAMLVLLAIHTSKQPVGYFDSTTILGLHDVDDVVEFAYGTVTVRTCCGDMSAGRFERTEDGHWLWHYEGPGKKNPYRRTLAVEPGLFSLKCQDPADPQKSWKLRRRLTAPSEEQSWKGKRAAEEITTWSVFLSGLRDLGQ